MPHETLSHLAYDVLGMLCGVAALPFLPFVLLTRHGRGLGERLGRLPPAVHAVRRPIWLHAASVGEVLAAQPLIRQLQQHHPQVPIVVSATTIAGRETARTHLHVNAVMLLPLDLRWIVGRVLRRLQPRCLIIVETELWPALIRAAAAAAVPCLIVSGRISERAAGRYAWIRWLTRPTLTLMDLCAMQTDADAARIVELGAPAARVTIAGSLKYARAAAAAAAATTAPIPMALNGRPLLIAASTHRGEEQAVLDACSGLWNAHPNLLLLIAPRRPERFQEVADLLARSGVRHARRSRLAAGEGDALQVLLLDSVGELPNVLPMARAVFVGGTLVPLGGHNVLEPAVFGKPVAFGPHTANVAMAAGHLLAAGAATQVSGAGDLAVEWQRLLAQPRLAEQMGAQGRAVIAAGAAVAERTYVLVAPFVGGEGDVGHTTAP